MCFFRVFPETFYFLLTTWEQLEALINLAVCISGWGNGTENKKVQVTRSYLKLPFTCKFPARSPHQLYPATEFHAFQNKHVFRLVLACTLVSFLFMLEKSFFNLILQNTCGLHENSFLVQSSKEAVRAKIFTNVDLLSVHHAVRILSMRWQWTALLMWTMQHLQAASSTQSRRDLVCVASAGVLTHTAKASTLSVQQRPQPHSCSVSKRSCPCSLGSFLFL